MILLLPDEQTGYADVDEALERAKYRMISSPPIDVSLDILAVMNINLKQDDYVYDKPVVMHSLAMMAIEKRSMDDARILAQYIRLSMKGKLT